MTSWHGRWNFFPHVWHSWRRGAGERFVERRLGDGGSSTASDAALVAGLALDDSDGADDSDDSDGPRRMSNRLSMSTDITNNNNLTCYCDGATGHSHT